MKRWIEWILGEVVARPPAPGWEQIVAIVVVFGGFAMVYGDVSWFGGHPMLTGPWRLAIHAGIPLMGVALWELRHKSRGRRLALLGTAILLSTFLAGGLGAVAWWRSHHLALQVPCVVGCLLLIGGLTRGGWSPEDWNAGVGDWRWWVPRMLVGLLLIIPSVTLVFVFSPELRQFYPRWEPARTSFWMVWVLNAGNAIDFVAWEWMFRGFTMMGIARSGRAWLAIAAQTIPFWLLHYPKPPAEFWLSLIGGFLAGWFCYRARSFWPLFVLHIAQMSTANVVGFLFRQL